MEALSRPRALHFQLRLCSRQTPLWWSLESPRGRSGRGVCSRSHSPEKLAWLPLHYPHPCFRLAQGAGGELMQPVLSFPPVLQAKQDHYFFNHGTDLCHQPLLCGQLPAQPPPPGLLQPCSPAGCSLSGPHHLPGTVGSAGAFGMGRARRGDIRWRQGVGGLGLPQRGCSHNHPFPRSGPVPLPTEPPCWPTAPTNTSCTVFLQRRRRRGSLLHELSPGPGWGLE